VLDELAGCRQRTDLMQKSSTVSRARRVVELPRPANRGEKSIFNFSLWSKETRFPATYNFLPSEKLSQKPPVTCRTIKPR
jgi:hypothetical protein